GRPQTPHDLTQHQCLIYTGSSREWVFRANGKRPVAIRPEGRLHTDNGDAILQWAIAGLGIATLPSFLLTDAIDKRLIEPLLGDYTRTDAGIPVVRPPGPYVPGKVRVLIDTLVERFGGEPVWDRCLMHERKQAAKS